MTNIVRLRNSDIRPGRFSIADAEIRSAERIASESGREVLVILHSHSSTSAAPSIRDRSALAYSVYPWAIAGFDRDDRFELRAFHAGSAAVLPVSVGRED